MSTLPAACCKLACCARLYLTMPKGGFRMTTDRPQRGGRPSLGHPSCFRHCRLDIRHMNGPNREHAAQHERRTHGRIGVTAN